MEGYRIRDGSYLLHEVMDAGILSGGCHFADAGLIKGTSET